MLNILQKQSYITSIMFRAPDHSAVKTLIAAELLAMWQRKPQPSLITASPPTTTEKGAGHVNGAPANATRSGNQGRNEANFKVSRYLQPSFWFWIVLCFLCIVLPCPLVSLHSLPADFIDITNGVWTTELKRTATS